MTPRAGLAIRHALLAGVATGLGLAPYAAVPPESLAVAVWVLAIAVRARRLPPLVIAAFACTTLAGQIAGSARLAAIDGGALRLADGASVVLRGAVTSAPRPVIDGVRFVLGTPYGRVAVDAPATLAAAQGAIVTVRGSAHDPSSWERSTLLRLGVAGVVRARRVRPSSDEQRGGLAGALDAIRSKAEQALDRGNPPVASALMRGFVLGQDDRIPPLVRDEFRRSGLAHILAVSGQNVMLLALLAVPIFGLMGIPVRSRLVAVGLVIAIYVPVAGGGASIQRAGIMGAAGLVAALASRPRARWYALLLAAAGTLAINPRATGDIGWQLSFAAVAGLLVLARPIARVIAGSSPSSVRRAAGEGLGMTIAATLATAPLIAHHFDVVSLTAIPANVLALPAVAPAMWLGMLAGALGQVPAFPVEPLSALGGVCAGYIGWVAHMLGGESAQVGIATPSPVATAAASAILVAGGWLACRLIERRRGLRLPVASRRVVIAAVAFIALVTVAPRPAWLGGGRDSRFAPVALTIRVLDVGQGDAILLQPRGALPILVDAGPPDGGAASRLADLGIDRLGALALTHDDLDHSGGLAEILGATHVDRLLTATGNEISACERIVCPRASELSTGRSVRSGRLRMTVLWPAPGGGTPGGEPNARSLVFLASVGEFDALLAADAESEIASFHTPPVEVLKVAHHGSADDGLDRLLGEARPSAAIISVGAGNRYGHPVAATLASLDRQSIPIWRTDEAGEVVVEVGDGGWGVG